MRPVLMVALLALGCASQSAAPPPATTVTPAAVKSAPADPVEADEYVTAPIIGASGIEHLDDAVAALDLSLSGEECCFLEEPYRPHSVRGHS